MTNEPQEASTLILKLDDDNPEGIDMMLRYLYLLKVSDFSDKAMFSSNYKAAEQALTLGDKYDLPELCSAGTKALIRCVKYNLPRWESRLEGSKARWICCFRKVWTWTQRDADSIREHIVEQIVLGADTVIEDEQFQALM